MSLTSLREAVLEIAEEMNKEADSPGGSVVSTNILKGYAKQLKIACKAAGEEQAPVQNPLAGFMVNPEAQREREVDKYRAEFRKNKSEVVERSNTEESFDGEMVEVLGSPDSPFYHSIHPFMPLDMLIPIAGGMYRLVMEDGVKKLVYDERQTKFQEESKKVKTATWDELKKYKTGN